MYTMSVLFYIGGGVYMSNSGLVCYTLLSPNNSGQRTHAIDRITPHCVVGQLSCENICGCFTSPSRQASCNYGIGKDGRISLCVEEKNRSWCSSSNANDQRAVTIECASGLKEPYEMNEKVYSSLINLCVDICKRNGKTKLLWFGDKEKSLNYEPEPNEMVLTVHRWFANKSCPGDWLYSRLSSLARTVTDKLGENNVVKNGNTDYVNKLPSVPFSVHVLIDDLNYRSGPSMKSAVKGTTGIGTFTIVEVRDGWGRLKSDAGWIWLKNQSYCTILGKVYDKVVFKEYKVRVDCDNLNIRTGAGTNYSKTGKHTGKGVFTIVDEKIGEGSKNGWGLLKSYSKNKDGWISLDFVTKV